LRISASDRGDPLVGLPGDELKRLTFIRRARDLGITLDEFLTKMPILLGHDFWVFHLPKLPRYGSGAWWTKPATILTCCWDRFICW
jgi:hypothetical protein